MTAESTETRKPAFLILGAPGSGKGTQGQILGQIPRFFHCACGDVFRSLDTRTPIGQRFVHYSSRGDLVPDELTIELWKAQIDATQPPVKVLAEMIQRITSLPVFAQMAKTIA